MILEIETIMLEMAKLYANKLNSKANLSILDEKLTLPRGVYDAGLWFGFMAGFKMCYKIQQERIKNEQPSTTTIS